MDGGRSQKVRRKEGEGGQRGRAESRPSRGKSQLTARSLVILMLFAT